MFTTTNIFISTAFTVFYTFLYVVFTLPFVSNYFLIPPEVFSLLGWLFNDVLLHSYIFKNFWNFLLVSISNHPLWLENILCPISIPLHLWRHICYITYSLSWRMHIFSCVLYLLLSRFRWCLYSSIVQGLVERVSAYLSCSDYCFIISVDLDVVVGLQ